MKTANPTLDVPPPVTSAPPPDHETSSPRGVVASIADFPEFQSIAAGSETGSLNHLMDVAVCVTAELGRVTMSIGDILKLGLGSVVELDRAVSEPVDLLVQGVPFARGEVVVIEDRFAIRIQEILEPKQAGKK
jgi:flagellar motor switch protein FliN/FliY